jgi:hypothetical protein
MIAYHVPSPAEFRIGAREHYAFLCHEFGFADGSGPEWADPKFSVCFWKGSLYVLIQGFSYGFALGTCIGRHDAQPSRPSELTLGFLVRTRRPDLLAPRFGGERGQLQEMIFQARALRETAPDFLAGDLTCWNSVLSAQAEESSRIRRETEASDRRQALDRATAQASTAFRLGHYRTTAALLQPHEASLTKAAAAMLMLALKRSSNAA